jgi:hypothetical protein
MLRERYFDDPAQLKKELVKRSDGPNQVAPRTLPNTCLLGGRTYSQGKQTTSCEPSLIDSRIRLWPIRSQVLADTIQPPPERPNRPNNHLNSPPDIPPRPHPILLLISISILHVPSPIHFKHQNPWHDIATITFPSQESFSDERRRWLEDKIALSPWVGVKEHRPLGGINRLRKRVSEETRNGRARENRSEVYFPKSVDELPEQEISA